MKKELQNLSYCNRALSLKKDIEGNFVLLGEFLYTIKKDLLYEPQWSSWTEFLFEMKMSENMAKKLIQIFQVFVLTYGFTVEQVASSGGWSSLQDVLPLVKSKKDAKKWLDTARELTVTDLRRSIKEARTGIDMTDCKHKDTYTITVCNDCGVRYRNESEESV